MHCKKNVSDFPVPAGMSLTKLPNSPWSGKIYLFPARESLVSDIAARDGKTVNLFLQYVSYCVLGHTGTNLLLH